MAAFAQTANILERMRRDARHFQIVALTGLIIILQTGFEAAVPPEHAMVAILAAVGTQRLIAHVQGWPFDWRSPVITALSLTLLLRTDGPALIAVAAALAIGSKAVLRMNGRHILNPAAAGIAITISLFDGAWVSPGQWGTSGWLMVFAVGAGLAVTHGAKRLEVPFCFLAAWGVCAIARALWLGDPMAIAVHQMSSGALLIFAFFMISDPMTAPGHQMARVGWVCLAAATGYALQSAWIVDAGPIFGLVAVAWLVPLLNRLLPVPKYDWRQDADSAIPAGPERKGAPRCTPS